MVCLGERFGARIWGVVGIWGDGFLNCRVWQHKKGKFSLTWGIYCWDFVSQNFRLKILSKHMLFHKSLRHEILKLSKARDSLSRFCIYPSPFHFLFTSYQMTIQSLSLTVLNFFLLCILNLAQSILHLQILGKIFLSLSFFLCFSTSEYPLISDSFSL